MLLGHPLNFPLINSLFFDVHHFFSSPLSSPFSSFLLLPFVFVNWFSLLSPLYIHFFFSNTSTPFLPLFFVTTHTQTPDIADHWPIANLHLHLHQYLPSHSRSLTILVFLASLVALKFTNQCTAPMELELGTAYLVDLQHCISVGDFEKLARSDQLENITQNHHNNWPRTPLV